MEVEDVGSGGDQPQPNQDLAATTSVSWENYHLDDVHSAVICASNKWALQNTDAGKLAVVANCYQWMQGTQNFDAQDPTSSDYLRPVFPPLSRVAEYPYEDGCLVGLMKKTYPGDVFICSLSETGPNNVGLAECSSVAETCASLNRPISSG